MKRNMSDLDRGIRVIVALTIVGLYFGNVITGIVALLLGLLAVIFMLTSSVSICPLYALFGVSTCAKSDKS